MKYITLTIFAILLSFASFANIGPITGDTVVCVGQSTYLNDTTSGGVWSSNNTLIATVDGSGYVVGITAGTVTISYSIGANLVTKTIPVFSAPAPITGPYNVCGDVTEYDSTAGGGYWTVDDGSYIEISFSYPNAAIIQSMGTGVGIVTFTDTDGCAVGKFVYSGAPPITGSTSTYVDSTILLNDPITGGRWSSSNTSVATVDTITGLVTGISAGTTTITYLCICSTSRIVNVFRAVGVPNLSVPTHSKVAIFPNPATTELSITSSDKITAIAIANLIGQIVYSNNYHNEQVQVDVSGLPTGMYLVTINGTEVRKFVKE